METSRRAVDVEALVESSSLEPSVPLVRHTTTEVPIMPPSPLSAHGVSSEAGDLVVRVPQWADPRQRPLGVDIVVSSTSTACSAVDDHALRLTQGPQF